MTLKDAIEHFGSRSELADALNITLAAISLWKGKIPRGRQFEIESLTRGALKADPTDVNDDRQVA